MAETTIADFTAAASGGPFKLSAHKGKPVVLYFYPKDNTPGCTTESQDFRDLHGAFVKAGAVVFGISRDSVKSHDGFRAKQELPFDLISDADEKVCSQFGVMKMKNMYGKQAGESNGARSSSDATSISRKSGAASRCLGMPRPCSISSSLSARPEQASWSRLVQTFPAPIRCDGRDFLARRNRGRRVAALHKSVGFEGNSVR